MLKVLAQNSSVLGWIASNPKKFLAVLLIIATIALLVWSHSWVATNANSLCEGRHAEKDNRQFAEMFKRQAEAAKRITALSQRINTTRGEANEDILQSGFIPIRADDGNTCPIDVLVQRYDTRARSLNLYLSDSVD